MMKQITIATATLILSMFHAPVFAEGKNMAARLGIGYANNRSVEMPSMQAKYYPSNDYAVSFSLGSDTLESASRLGAMGRVYRNIFHEDNLIFYGGAGCGLLSVEQNGRTDTGFELQAFVGVEFFIPGIDSLGISFDTGLGVTSISSGVRFRTMADHPLRAGMVFYF